MADNEPGLSGLWMERFLDEAMAEHILDQEELEPVA
jgi:hypothetical protein